MGWEVVGEIEEKAHPSLVQHDNNNRIKTGQG
jgi:hypothetical protein